MRVLNELLEMNCKGDPRLPPIQNCLNQGMSRKFLLRLCALILCTVFTASISAGQNSQGKNVLVVTEAGFSNTLPNVILQEITDVVGDTPQHHVECSTE